MRYWKRLKKQTVWNQILLWCIGVLSIFLLCIYTDKMIVYAAENQPEAIAEEEMIQESIPPQELDLGDYSQKMTVGEKQLLTVTILPLGAENNSLSYHSDNEAVAKINGMGRITAISEGTATITVICGSVSEGFLLTVEKPVEETAKEVTDIEVADYETSLAVDQTMNLSATVVPLDAEEQTISFSSSDTNIATVSQTGEVKGIAPGNVTIRLQAGTVVKEIKLTIKVVTTDILLNEKYVVLKVGETHKIETSVRPEGASKAITYKSMNTEVATVNADGLVDAKKIGSTTILVSNEDISNAVTIIVNANVQENNDLETIDADEAVLNNETSEGVLKLLSQNTMAEVPVAECPLLTKEILIFLKKEEKVLIVSSEQWKMTVDGAKIVNCENELKTDIQYHVLEDGVEFCLNDGQNLPGELLIEFNDFNSNYLYLYNDVKEQYERLNLEIWNLDIPGTYLATTKKIESSLWKNIWITGGIGICLLLGAGYVVTKKKYWFW